MTELINIIKKSLEKTDNYESNIKDVDEIYAIEGMSGKKTRHFYNNVCS